MKRLLAIAAIVGLMLAAAPPVASVGDNGTGVFWLTSGFNGTGEARNFNVGPDHLEQLVSLRYNSNCSGTCDSMQNSVSSIIFSCGTLGTPIDDNDSIHLFDMESGNPAGNDVIYNPIYPGQCSNGTIIINLSSFMNNLASSMTTNE